MLIPLLRVDDRVGVLTELSIGKWFLAGVIPGILLVLYFVIPSNPVARVRN